MQALLFLNVHIMSFSYYINIFESIEKQYYFPLNTMFINYLYINILYSKDLGLRTWELGAGARSHPAQCTSAPVHAYVVDGIVISKMVVGHEIQRSGILSVLRNKYTLKKDKKIPTIKSPKQRWVCQLVEHIIASIACLAYSIWGL